MALRANLITTKTIDAITLLNEGLRPAESCLNGNTFFVYSDEFDVPNEIVDRAEFTERFHFTSSGRIDNAIEKN